MFALEGIDHVALCVRDVGRSVDWYQTVLGLERRYKEAWGDYPAVVGIGSTSIALFPAGTTMSQSRPERGVLTLRHLAFRATARNFADAQLELTGKGIVFEFQDHQISHSIYLHDPDGYEIEITTYELG